MPKSSKVVMIFFSDDYDDPLQIYSTIYNIAVSNKVLSNNLFTYKNILRTTVETTMLFQVRVEAAMKWPPSPKTWPLPATPVTTLQTHAVDGH